MDSSNVPMMFRAQVQGRCQVHRVDKNKQRQDADKWVDEWKSIFPKESLPTENVSQPSQPVSRSQQRPNQPNNKALARPVQNNLALRRPPASSSVTSQQSTTSTTLKIPQFTSQVKAWEYTINWRLVSNSGQDEGVIRPIIGAKGFPHLSGASMKGAFLRACRQMYGKDTAQIYCGTKSEKANDDGSSPGCLRFHGAYPVNMDWTKSLVDIVHRQDEKQVIKDNTTNANAQISLYQAKLRFGFSSTKELTDSEWQKIQNIWERALAQGIGSRVSAGYGHFVEVSHQANPENRLLQIRLKGQGAASQLVNGTKEFRPNMFKAALRGHTLRLLGGMTDEITAKNITQQLWGGFGTKVSIVGSIGINFDFKHSDISYKKNQKYYELPEGKLNILCTHSQIDNEQRAKLLQTAEALVKFFLIFGGFGKSWRRVCHKQFYTKDYFENEKKQIIGCHWQLLDESQYYPVNDLKDIATFINVTMNLIRTWIPENKRFNTGIDRWREAWYSPKVEVWGRFAETGISKAIAWFHQPYSGNDSIKNPHTLTGSMGNTGLIWHRMYPRIITNNKDKTTSRKGYVELLTIFPDASSKTRDFLKFLREEKEFTKIW